VSCAGTAEPIDFPFGLWTQVGRSSTSSIVFARWCQFVLMGGHIASTWRIRLNHLSTEARRLRSNYFHHLLSLDTPTYTVVQIACYFKPNTVLWTFHTLQLTC